MRRPIGLLAFSAVLLLGVASAQDEGQSAYQANCVACHQETGEGLPGAFPPLAGHAADFLAVEGGRTYLIHVLLYGLQGQIEVEGQTYNGVMPPWSQLDDETIAAILNFITSNWGDEVAMPETHEAFTAEEVAAERDLGLTPADVHAERSELPPGE